MDLDDIPDIDPVLPAPDFFDELLDRHNVTASSSSSSGMQPQDDIIAGQLPPENILDCVTAEQSLKYDDELCEYNEFLVGLETTLKPNPGESSEKAEGSSQKVEEETEVEQPPSQKVQSTDDLNEKSAEPKSDESLSTIVGPEIEEGVNGDADAISLSEPTTPQSTASSSAVIRLIPVPKLAISVSSSTKKKREESPQRTLRGRVDTPNKRETRAKRKLSDDEEFEPDDDHDEEDEEVNKRKDSSVTRRSGRQTRKSMRLGNDTVENENDSPTDKRSPKGRRMPKKTARYGFEDDSEEEKETSKIEEGQVESSDSECEVLFEPVKKKKRKSNYWTDEDGITHFDDGNGITIKLKRLSIALVRLSEADIARLKDGDDLSSDSDEDDSAFLLEVCIDNFLSAQEAVKGGAKRIELCSALSEGGLTPTGGLLTLVKEKFENVPVFVMIRPRGGDFVYTTEEVEIMARDISYYKQMGADGFVFGLLTKDCKVDVDNCKLLKQTAFPLECTFHRAFDKVFNPLSALETIISLGFNRILTSGQAATAQLGIPLLKRLVEAAGSRITILAGAGVNERNVGDIVRRTGVTEVHGSASKSVTSSMCAPGPSKSHKRGGNKSAAVKMGTTDDSVIKVTDSNLVQQIIRRARKQIK